MKTNKKSDKNKFKVFLAEDEPIVRKVHCMMLEKIGYTVDIAMSGKKALMLFNKNKYDVILMDLGLPDVNGIKVAAEIRFRENNVRCTPIIALTAFIQGELEDECFSVGIDRIVTKSVKMNDLKKIIQETVRQ